MREKDRRTGWKNSGETGLSPRECRLSGKMPGVEKVLTSNREKHGKIPAGCVKRTTPTKTSAEITGGTRLEKTVL